MSAILDGYVEGALRGRNRQLAQTTQMLDEAQENTERLIQAVDARDAHIVKLNAANQGLFDEAQRLRARISELEAALVKSEADAKGVAAQAKALLDENPGTALRAESGIPYKSKPGMKTKLRLIYEQAFDTYMRSKAIANPAERRTD